MPRTTWFSSIALLGLLLAGRAVAGAEPLAYVALSNARKVAVVDVGKGKAVRTFSVSVSPHGIAASAGGRFIFVPDLLQEKTIRVLDAQTGREVRQIEVGAPVHHLTLAPDRRRLYATLTSVGRVAIVEVDTWRVRVVEVGGAPDYAVTAPEGAAFYVSDLAGSTLAVVDPDAAEVRSRITVTDGPGHGVVSRDSAWGFFTASGKGAVSMIDLRRGRQTNSVLTGPDPHGVGIGHGGRRLFVSNHGDGTVTVINLKTREVERRIKVGQGPEHLTASPDGRLILVALPSDNLVVVIDARRLEVVRRIQVGGDPHQIAF
ncbi:MAG: cytochrome D1 domain-containing protein [candidate division NC10 bacterium]